MCEEAVNSKILVIRTLRRVGEREDVRGAQFRYPSPFACAPVTLECRSRKSTRTRRRRYTLSCSLVIHPGISQAISPPSQKELVTRAALTAQNFTRPGELLIPRGVSPAHAIERASGIEEEEEERSEAGAMGASRVLALRTRARD